MQEWEDFQKKVKYIYEKLCNSDIDTLVEYFSTSNDLKNHKQSRKKTIKNWLNSTIRKPNKFTFAEFKIGKLQMLDGANFLTVQHFSKSSFEDFKIRVDDYLDSKNQKLYIYYDTNHISIDIELENNTIKTDDKKFNGKLLVLNGMNFISFDENRFYIIYSNSIKIDNNIYLGVVLDNSKSDDFKLLGAVITNFKLDKNRIEDYKQNINKLEFNLSKIATLFNNSNSKLLINLILEILSKYNLSTINSFEPLEFPDSLEYKKIVLDYFALPKRVQNIQIPTLNILYTISKSNIEQFEDENSNLVQLLKYQQELIEQNRLSINYLFILRDKNLFTDYLAKKLLDISEVALLKVKIDKSDYEEIIFLDDKIGNNHINLFQNNLYIVNSISIKNIKNSYNKLFKNSLPIKEFIQNEPFFNKLWYIYTYTSDSNKDIHEIKVKMNYNTIESVFSYYPKNRVNYGKIIYFEHFKLLIFEHGSIVKFFNYPKLIDINIISIIGNEKVNYKDILLFGILSRNKIPKDDVLYLLDKIHKKEEIDFRMKISNEIQDVIKEYLSKKGG